MPNVYFNSETGQAPSLEDARQALLLTADVYYRMKQHCAVVYRGIPEAGNLCLVRDQYGFFSSLKDCVKAMPQPLDKIKLFLAGLSHGAVIDCAALDNLEEWVVDQFGVHSPLLTYAVQQKGMMLTVAVTQDWKQDFFTFQTHSEAKLPNLWGQQDITSIERWLNSWYADNTKPHDELQRQCDDVTLCSKALPQEKFSKDEWRSIIEHFQQARSKRYAVGGNNLIKDLSPHATKYGSLKELRLMSEGIRILFALHDGKPIVGGHYRYGTGATKLRDNRSELAIIRINVHS